MESLRELLFHKLTKELGNEIVHRNGGRPRVDDGVDDVLPNTLSVAFRGINGWFNNYECASYFSETIFTISG